MSARGRQKPHYGISLFPFLAVLICTLGALIVLLLIILQQARASAGEIAAAPQAVEEVPIDVTALRQQLEDANWRRDLLEQQRTAKAAELSDQRLQLAHLEDHIRRLQDQWKDLQAKAEQLQGQGDSKLQSRERVAEEMTQITSDIAAAQLDLTHAQQKAAGRPKSFSIIPYQGPNGTSRRPIYIECTADAVILQPEGFALDARDFEGPLGPGNPLDACLRAVREYLARNPEFTKQGEPYPLLIVRPDGVLSYAAARAAMKSWDDEFGYELVEQEMRLAYPQPDPVLRSILERAVVDARRRQDLLAAAAPSRYKGTTAGNGGGNGGGTGGGARAAPQGGFRSVVDVPDFGADGGGNGGTGGGEGPGFGRRPANVSGGGADNGGTGGGYARGGTGRRGTGGDATDDDGSGNPLREGAGGTSREMGIGRGGGNSYNENYNGSQITRSTGGKTQPGLNSANGANGQSRNGSSGSTATGSNTGNGTSDGSTGSGRPRRPGMPGQSAGQPGDPNDPRASSDVEGEIPAGARPAKAGDVKPLAARKGANWGLPNFTNKATGITRPVRIRIEADRLLIVPERGERRSAKAVAIDDSMSRATEELVSQIWDEVDNWGIAVANGYWKPILNVEVAPGQDELFAELQTLLDGSGLEVRRRSP